MRAAVHRLGPGILLYVAMATFAMWHLQRIEHPNIPNLPVWAIFALLPALLAAIPGTAGAPRRFLVLLVPFLVVAIGLASGHWPFRPHLLGDSGYFGRVGGDVREGLHRWISTVLPYDHARAPELRVVVLLAIAVLLAALAATILVWQTPMPTIVLAFVPFLVSSTVFELGAPLLRAAIMLGLALAALAILGGRGSRAVQIATVALVVGMAIAIAALPGVAKAAFVDWRHIGQTDRKGVSVAFVWNQTYGPLRRPAKPVSLLRVSASRSSYWRVAVLAHFNGIAWVEQPDTTLAGRPPDLVVPPSLLVPDTWGHADDGRLAAHFTNLGWDTTALAVPITALALHAIPTQVGGVRLGATGVVQVDQSPPVGSSWNVEYVPPQPDVADLVNQGSAYPPDVRANLELLDTNAKFPAWGTPDRERTVRDILNQQFFDVQLQSWKQVYAEARRITRDAASPYEAATAIEQYFHDRFTYSEKADYSQAAEGPLPAFFLGSSRAGYCQMFSGTMTVMLRMLGIPARVAEGFTPGTRKAGAGSYLVTDRDAHAWVEVYVPRYGWLPFEPTPTRSLPYNYSTTSPDFQNAVGGAVKRLPDDINIRKFATRQGIDPANPATSRGPAGGGRAGREGPSPAGPPPARPWRPGFFIYLIGGAAAVLLLIVLAKQARSLRVYARRTPEHIAAAVRSDLEAYVRDQGVGAAVRSLTPAEFGRMLRREFGVDASRWSELQSRARYGPPDGRAYHIARDARREARVVKRRLRRGIARADRLRGAVRVRSLLP